MKNNIVITGRGLVTPLGTGLAVNEEALKNGKSGISFVPEWKEMGLESHVGGIIDETKLLCPVLDKKSCRYMTPHTIMGTVATYEALQEAGLETDSLRHRRIAIVLGHGGSAHMPVHEGAKILEETHKSKRVSPFTVPKVMPSSAVANISLIFGIKGESYVISSACASGAHSVILASRLLQCGHYDMVLTGGTEEVNWIQALGFDSMRALSRGWNETPEKASRPFDKKRDGFVVAAGAGILVLETEENASKRNAKIIAKITGSGANSNTTDMVSPDAESSAQVMLAALQDANLKPSDIDYINTHGTATPVGDPIEMAALKSIFYETNPKVAINSTKSMTGHMIGATGSIEIIFCSQMIEKGFISPNINLDEPDEEFLWANLPKETIHNTQIKHALSNSFAFGGTNSCVILSAVK